MQIPTFSEGVRAGAGTRNDDVQSDSESDGTYAISSQPYQNYSISVARRGTPGRWRVKMWASI